MEPINLGEYYALAIFDDKGEFRDLFYKKGLPAVYDNLSSAKRSRAFNNKVSGGMMTHEIISFPIEVSDEVLLQK